VGKVQRPVLDLSRLIPSFAQVFVAIDRLEELERLPEESGEESMRFAETPDVEIDNITFRYVEGEAPVFSHFSCKFPFIFAPPVIMQLKFRFSSIIIIIISYCVNQL